MIRTRNEGRNRARAIAVIATLPLAVLGATGIGATATAAPSIKDQKISICHATGSTQHPFAVIKLKSGSIPNGHAGHSDDVIPSFTYLDGTTVKAFPGVNATSQTEAFIANKCVSVPVSVGGSVDGGSVGGPVVDEVPVDTGSTGGGVYLDDIQYS